MSKGQEQRVLEPTNQIRKRQRVLGPVRRIPKKQRVLGPVSRIPKEQREARPTKETRKPPGPGPKIQSSSKQNFEQMVVLESESAQGLQTPH